MKKDNLLYDVSRDEAMKILDVSNATLGRYMKEEKISFEYVQGKTRPTPVFNRGELEKLAGIVTGEAVDDHEIINDVKPETALIKTASKKIISKSSQDNLKKISNDNISEMIENALLIPHKIYLTLAEASKLTGFPQSQLKQFSELKFGRRVIKRSKLEKI